MTNFTLRPARVEDLEQAVPMFNLCSRNVMGADEFTMEEYVAEWTAPSCNLNEDIVVAETPDGQIVGAIEAWNSSPPFVQSWVWARVHPDYVGQGIGSALMEWAESRTREKLPLAPPDARVYMRVGEDPRNPLAEPLFLEQGYQPVRYSYTMERIFSASPEAPRIPEGIIIRPMYAPDEYEPIHRLDKEAFRDHWGIVERPFEVTFNDMMHFLREGDFHDPALWFVAMDGDRMAGVSLCTLKARGAPDAGYVDTLAVHREYRHRGLGLALLLHSFHELYQRGQRKVQLGVDAGNLTGALRLYQRAGMEPIRQFNLYEKELRAGRELSRQV